MPSSDHIVFEEKLNILLSQLLNTSGIVSNSELLSPHARRDILVSYQGLNIVIEGSYSKSDAVQDAKKRMDQLGNDVAIALCYPGIFYQNQSEREIQNKLKECIFNVKLIVSSESSDTPSLFPHSTKRKMVESFSGWQEYRISDLIDLIKELGQFIISEEGMVEIENQVAAFIDSYVLLINASQYSSAVVKNFYGVLYELYGFSFGDPEDIKEAIFAQSILSVLLSSIYYETIRYAHGLKSLNDLKEIKGNSQNAIISAIEKILEINYEPIFKLTNQLLPFFPALPDMFDQLINLSCKISAKRTLLRKDIAGRIYHRIVGDWSVRKGLATYYTSIPSAYLLVYLAEVDLSRICDFACGSGTLLTAAYSAANTKYRYGLLKQRIDKEALDIEKDFHGDFIKNCYGFDVLNYATQISALNLAFHSPETPSFDFSLYPIPLGCKKNLNSLGSLEIIKEESSLRLMKNDISKIGIKSYKKQSLGNVVKELGLSDFIIMNPPFTRATGRGGRERGGLFGFILDEEIKNSITADYIEVRNQVRSYLTKKAHDLVKRLSINSLSNIFSDPSFQAFRNIGAAGEGLLFLYLAHTKIKENGKICFVLPKSLLTGVSWFLARCLLVSEYQIEYIVVSYDSSKGYNFSESTSLSECLIIAKRTKNIQRDHTTKFVLLLSKPKNCMESIALSNRVKEGGEYVEAGNSSAFVLNVPMSDMEKYVDNLGRFAYLPHLNLQKTILNLLEGEIHLGDNKGNFPITRLNTLIESIGIDRHQFHDNFKMVMGNVPGSVTVLYGGEEDHRKKIYRENVDYALPIKNGSKIYNASSGKLFIPERIRVTTVHYLSFISKDNCLSNIFYVLKLKNENDRKIKALCIFLNSTWGILIILSSREETEGAWIGIKMSQWRLMPILDLEQLSDNQLNELASLFDKFKDKELKRLPEQYDMNVGIDQNRLLLDSSFLAIMGIPVEKEGLLDLYKQIGSSLKQWIG